MNMVGLTGWWHREDHALGLFLLDQGDNNVVGVLNGYNNVGQTFALPFSGTLSSVLGKASEPMAMTLTKVGNAWPPHGPATGEFVHTPAGNITLTPIMVADNSTDVGVLVIEVDVNILWSISGELRPSPLPPPGHLENFKVQLTRLI